MIKSAYLLSKFDEEDRLKLLYYGHFEYYEKDSIIEDINNKIVIIAEGTIIAKSKEKEFVLKAGDNFGEQDTSIGVPNDNSLVFCCAANCKLLIIPIDVLNEVNENLITVKFKDNITLLQSTPYFAKLHGKALLPILSNAKIKKYSYGDKIIEEGNLVTGLYIIKKGQCKVCIEAKGLRSVKRVQFTKNYPGGIHSAREKTDCIAYHNNIPLASLTESNTFGGKSLLPINPSDSESGRYSLLSIVADSAKVKVLIITRDLLSYLSCTQRVLFTS